VTRTEQAVLIAAAAIGAVAVLAVLGGVGVRVRGEISYDDGEPDRNGRRTLARHVPQAGAITGPHPLYRRPTMPGAHRTMLQLGGWDWILNPPSEWTP